MKAKEYVDRFRKESNDEERVYLLLDTFIEETSSLIRQRGKNSGLRTVVSVVRAVFLEQHQKWEAMCRLEPIIQMAWFERLMNTFYPGYLEIMK